mgnify:CR=1 FL=1
MDLQVLIDEKAKNFISKKGNLITITSLSIDNCCVPISEVSIQYKEPDDPKMFKEMKSGDISLFIDKKLEFKDCFVKIKHSGFGPFQSVQVDGLVRF